MKRIHTLLVAAIAALMPSISSAQQQSDPAGHITYSLPTTIISLDVTAVKESFYAGPYAKYAEKYLGIKVDLEDNTSFQITNIVLTPFVEADLNCRYSITAPKELLENTFLQLTTAGLVAFADARSGESISWRFPMNTTDDFASKGLSSNVTSESTTLYKSDKKESAFSKVAIQQNMLVEKSLEKKAAEAAQTILDIRKQRYQIVTGDTDATYSGEAMAAAIQELTRLEKEYLMMFTGYTDTQIQEKRFEVTPVNEPDRKSVILCAFRLSDQKGLVGADDISGVPVVMEITPQSIATIAEDPKATSKKKVEGIHYRIPATCLIKINQGIESLLQCRIPVYQLGVEAELPLTFKLK